MQEPPACIKNIYSSLRQAGRISAQKHGLLFNHFISKTWKLKHKSEGLVCLEGIYIRWEWAGVNMTEVGRQQSAWTTRRQGNLSWEKEERVFNLVWPTCVIPSHMTSENGIRDLQERQHLSYLFQLRVIIGMATKC